MRRRSYDERLKRSLAIASTQHRLFPEETPRHIEFHEQQGGLARAIAVSFGNMRELARTRGDKWSATYHQRKWSENAEIEERTAAAYRELLG